MMSVLTYFDYISKLLLPCDDKAVVTLIALHSQVTFAFIQCTATHSPYFFIITFQIMLYGKNMVYWAV